MMVLQNNPTSPEQETISQKWSARADYYDALFADLSNQAISHILVAAGNANGQTHLDIACGTGHLVQAASQCGWDSQGVDIAGQMIARARQNYPAGQYQVGNGEKLPFATSSLDLVTCAFGLRHMARPTRAILEIARVLKPGGQFICTQWLNGAAGNQFFSLSQTALKNVGLAATASRSETNPFRYGNQATNISILTGAGFSAPRFQQLALSWHGQTANDFMTLIEKVSSHTAALYANHPPALRRLLEAELHRLLEMQRHHGQIEIEWRALLTQASKP